MDNPWLHIPLTDYESHMSLPAIAQAGMIADEFGTLLRTFRPKSVAVIGCAGGNGFDRIPAETTRVVGVDINPAYIRAAAERYGAIIPTLELFTADIQHGIPTIAPVDLVFAALVFEYVAPEAALENIARICLPGGRLCVLLQAPCEQLGHITPSPYASLHALSPIMRLLPPDELAAHALRAGFVRETERSLRLDSGKQFFLQMYIR